jgi:hypothetical protein
MNYRALLIVAMFVTPVALAQTLTGVKVEPAQIKAGESATITAEFEVAAGINCGLRLHFGDGSTMDYKINQTKDVPLVVTHAYAKPGSYEVKAEPKRNEWTMGCGGKNQTTRLDVAAISSAPAASKASVAHCPDGWKLDAKSVNKKTGAYTCRAKAGTPAPAGKLECPGNLGYFENSKKGMLGCQ